MARMRPPEDANWRTLASCRPGAGDSLEASTSRFFPPEAEQHGGARTGMHDDIKGLCQDCVVRGACLHFALSNREKHGVWGGFDATELRHLRPRVALGLLPRSTPPPGRRVLSSVAHLRIG